MINTEDLEKGMLFRLEGVVYRVLVVLRNFGGVVVYTNLDGSGDYYLFPSETPEVELVEEESE